MKKRQYRLKKPEYRWSLTGLIRTALTMGVAACLLVFMMTLAISEWNIHPFSDLSLDAQQGNAARWMKAQSIDESASVLVVQATPSSLPPEPIDAVQQLVMPVPDGEVRTLSVPILMYHYLSVPPADADRFRLDLSVTPDHFREQLAWLKAQGYETISLYQLLSALNTGSPALPERPIILTFDDGYADNYQYAFPLLKEYGYTATFFILTDVTDRSEPGYLTWEMLREMSDAGMSIEVHGREHFDFSNRNHDWLVYHLLGPMQTIEANLGYTPRFIAYPLGSYDAQVIATAQELGYWGGITTHYGRQHSGGNPFEVQRLRVRGGWILDDFIKAMSMP
jgi:peptidoglycan/xylan/chitin deacetylase (PgdA/CDA1 family)